MKLLYTNENRFLVSNVKNIIKNAGINFGLKNEYIGGGAGDLSPFDTWLELWIEDEDYERALELIEPILNKQISADWICSKCKEKNAAAFDYCWNCENEKEN